MITDIRSYTTLESGFSPFFVVRDNGNNVFVSTSPNPTLAVSLSGDSPGAMLIPFRPAQSPEPWMYIAVREDYRKISTPDDSNNITTRNVGLQEPQLPPQASPMQMGLVEFTSGAADWTNSGTAGAISDATRTSDTIGDMIPDPVMATRWSIEVSSTQSYQIGQTVYLDVYQTVLAVIQDVVPPIDSVTGIAISAIRYASGSTGACVIVPTQNAISPIIPGQVTTPVSDSILTDPVIAGLRRGALIELVGDTTETVLVLSVTKGPTGQFSFECETVGTFAAGDTITGLPTIVLEHYQLDTSFEGDPLETTALEYSLSGSGVGTVQQALTTNPFTTLFYAGNSGLEQTAQLDDYVNFTIQMSDPSKLVVGRITFNVGSVVDYTTDFYYAEFTSADLIRNQPPIIPASTSGTASSTPSFEEFVRQYFEAQNFEATVGLTADYVLSVPAYRENWLRTYNAMYGNVSQPTTDTDTTVYPASSYVVIQLPIRTLTHGGTNATRTLADCNGVQISIQTTAAVDVSISCFWIGGGGQPDVGRTGSPYYYLVRGRDSRTGVRSNASPSTRYGVSPRRQRVTLEVVDTVLDAQMDTWDWYRYGGSLLSWQYIGSSPNSAGGTDTFVDNLFDTSITTTAQLERDNFQPWPSIDRPFSFSGVSAAITGTILVLTFTASADVPDNILRWLPGTLMLVDDVAYTLWTRPTQVSSTVYVLESAECMGAGTATTVKINEPILARQRLPYVFGPDAAGTVFGCGDPLRPGTLSYSKSYDPDSVPDAYNREIVQPSEPLLGGIVIDGLALVSSSARWWALYPQFGQDIGANRYQVVERPFGRGLAAPYGYCSDGKLLFFVAKDGIYAGDSNSAKSLTDPDLRDLFPHEGVEGRDIEYAGYTVYAPDYSRSQAFRLSYCKSYLYFDYEDHSGLRRTLVLDLAHERPCWSVDDYGHNISVHYWLEGPENNMEVDPYYPDSLYSVLVMGDDDNNVFVQRDLSNDAGIPISCAVSTFEYNGGDKRADQWWGDGMLDATAHAEISVQPVSNRTLIGTVTTITIDDERGQHVINSSSLEVKYLGYLVEWTDDFDYYYELTEPTKLFAWQPLYQQVPLRVYTWHTQGTSFGLQGYFHIYQILAAYRATSDVTLTIDAFDGNDPLTITLPSTEGEERKVLFPVSFNKGLLYFFHSTSAEPWYPYFDAWEFYVGQWGRVTPYQIFTDVEAPKGIGRSIE